MGLIKANTTPSTSSSFNLTDIEDAAQRLLAMAQSQADQLLAAAKNKAAELLKQAREQGHLQGHAAGHAEGLAAGQAAGEQASLQQIAPQVTQAAVEFAQLLQQLHAHRRQVEDAAPRAVAELAIAIARRVTGRLGATDPAVLEHNLTQAVRLAVTKSNARVLVHSESLAHVESLLAKLNIEFPSFSGTEIIGDDTIAPGGCRVLCGGGEIDADLDNQIDRIASQLVPGSETSRDRKGATRGEASASPIGGHTADSLPHGRGSFDAAPSQMLSDPEAA